VNSDKKRKRKTGPPARRPIKAKLESSRARKRKVPVGPVDPLAGSLVEFFRRSPLVGVELDLERDRTATRDIQPD